MALKEYKPGTTFPGRMGRTIGEVGAGVAGAAPGQGGRAERAVHRARRHRASGSSAATARRSTRRTSTSWPRTACSTPTCTPPRSARRTRSCMLTGRNHHSNAMSCITEGSEGYPGSNGVIPFENGFLSEILLQHGYNTYAIGKWHLTPAEQISAAGPYDRWPLGRGFERYYGFLGGDTSQYYPDLVYDNHQVEPPKTPEEGYHLTEDLVDKAISFIADSQAARARQAVLHVLLHGRPARAASCAEGVGRQVQGQVRRRLGCLPREGLQASRRSWASSRRARVLSRHDPDVQDWRSSRPTSASSTPA